LPQAQEQSWSQKSNEL
jgi:hypothetical protein